MLNIVKINQNLNISLANMTHIFEKLRLKLNQKLNIQDFINKTSSAYNEISVDVKRNKRLYGKARHGL
jgi:hypothetical protein